MEFDHRRRYASTGGATTHEAPTPGKQTLTQSMVQMPPAVAPSSARAEPATTPPLPVPSGPRPTLQMLFGGPRAAAAQQPASTAPAPGSGEALPPALRGDMERAFGADFAGVRVHHGPHVTDLGALAYAQGSDLHFAPGAYDPASQSGREMIGHELAHVVQQGQGRVAVPQGKGAPVNADATLEAEADAAGARAANSLPAGIGAGATTATGAMQLKGGKGEYGSNRERKKDTGQWWSRGRDWEDDEELYDDPEDPGHEDHEGYKTKNNLDRNESDSDLQQEKPQEKDLGLDKWPQLGNPFEALKPPQWPPPPDTAPEKTSELPRNKSNKQGRKKKTRNKRDKKKNQSNREQEQKQIESESTVDFKEALDRLENEVFPEIAEECREQFLLELQEQLNWQPELVECFAQGMEKSGAIPDWAVDALYLLFDKQGQIGLNQLETFIKGIKEACSVDKQEQWEKEQAQREKEQENKSELEREAQRNQQYQDLRDAERQKIDDAIEEARQRLEQDKTTLGNALEELNYEDDVKKLVRQVIDQLTFGERDKEVPRKYNTQIIQAALAAWEELGTQCTTLRVVSNLHFTGRVDDFKGKGRGENVEFTRNFMSKLKTKECSYVCNIHVKFSKSQRR